MQIHGASLKASAAAANIRADFILRAGASIQHLSKGRQDDYAPDSQDFLQSNERRLGFVR
jgi:hypothetical protein